MKCGDKMNKFESNRISKSEFIKLSEDDLIFITNPGRMGDEDGSTFIIKHGKELAIYRIDDWMYPKTGEKVDILLNDAIKQFPKWFDTWKHGEEKDYNGKYKYIYMGFGNGLSIDKSIYSEFESYLNDSVEEYLEDISDGEKESLKYAAIYNTWKKAFINMVNDEGYILKKISKRR